MKFVQSNPSRTKPNRVVPYRFGMIAVFGWYADVLHGMWNAEFLFTKQSHAPQPSLQHSTTNGKSARFIAGMKCGNCRCGNS